MPFIVFSTFGRIWEVFMKIIYQRLVRISISALKKYPLSIAASIFLYSFVLKIS